MKRHLLPALHSLPALLATTAAIFFMGCGGLDTTYGTTDRRKESVQGFVVLRKQLNQHFEVRSSHLMSDRIKVPDYTALVYAARNNKGPSEEALQWLVDWLYAEPNRSAAILLRDGGIASELCYNWAEQAQAESNATQNQADKARLRSIAGNLRLRAQREAEEEKRFELQPEIGEFSYDAVDLTFERINKSIIDPALSGTWSAGIEAPPPFLTASYHVPTDDPATEPLLSYEDTVSERQQALGVTISVGHSQLILFTTSAPFLDGALPDADNRYLTKQLVDALVPEHHYSDAPQKLAWVRNLRVGTGEEANTNILQMVFTQPPVSYIIWHLTALLLLFLLWKNRWLGRREQPIEKDHQHFLRHVESLAKHLKEDHASRDCAQAIATYRGHGTAPAGQDETSQRRWVDNQLTPDDESAADNPPAPTQSPSTPKEPSS